MEEKSREEENEEVENIRKCARLQGRHVKIKDIAMARANEKDKEGNNITSHNSFSV
jgi:hypothetical protein